MDNTEAEMARKRPRSDESDPYFRSYTGITIHEEMLRDYERTNTYRRAILHYAPYLRDKVVLDVGAGTGILSAFCVEAGARKVYAVEASGIAEQAALVFAANAHLSDRVVLLRQRVEDVELPEKVDAIVSEWMGYFLVYESMFESVALARDRWLKPGGMMLPSHARMYAALLTDADFYESKIEFWRDVKGMYGVDMSPLVPYAKQCELADIHIDAYGGENLLSWAAVLKDVDCNTATAVDIGHTNARMRFKSFGGADLHGLVVWFDVAFAGLPKQVEPKLAQAAPSDASNGSCESLAATLGIDTSLVLRTSPEVPPTHWRQAALYLNDPIALMQDDAVEAHVDMRPHPTNRRLFDATLEVSVNGGQIVRKTFRDATWVSPHGPTG